MAKIGGSNKKRKLRKKRKLNENRGNLEILMKWGGTFMNFVEIGRKFQYASLTYGG